MHLWARRILAAGAIYAIALQGILTAFTPVSLQAAADPLSVICHSLSQSADNTQNGSPGAPVQSCDHCVLCNAAPAAPPAQAVHAGAQTARGEVLHIPAAQVVHAAAVFQQNLARGPPRTA